MKNFFLKTTRYLITSLFLFQSCEDWVDVDYPHNQLGTSQVFADVQTADAALNGVYAKLRDNSILSGTQEGAGHLFSLYADDLDSYHLDENGYYDIAFNTIQPSNNVVFSVWSQNYAIIYATNLIIEKTEDSSQLADTDKSRIIAEAILVRSLIYFYLQQTFGQIPYTQSTDYEYNRSLSKLSEEELGNQLIEDLTQIINDIPAEYRHPERIYPNKSILHFLLANLYLTKGQYNQAEYWIKKVIENPNYQFQNDLNEVFHNSSLHILWQLPPETIGLPVWESQLYYFENSPPIATALSNHLLNSFEETDLRKSTWIETVVNNDVTYYRAAKYKNIIENTSEYSILFRLEEAYFILAEALAYQNKMNEAIPFLNYTRQRAGLEPLEPIAQDNFILELLKEKRREFFTEKGIRFWDLKRNNRLNDLSTVKPNWTEFKKVWPIPLNELLLNPNLNPQNDGY